MSNFVENLLKDIKARLSPAIKPVETAFNAVTPAWKYFTTPKPLYTPNASLDNAVLKYKSFLNNFGKSLGVPDHYNDPINPNTALGKFGQGVQRFNNFIENAPVIGDIGYRIPKEYGTMAGDQIASGIKQIQSQKPSNVFGYNIPANVAGPAKIGLGGLSLTGPAIAGSYAYEGIKSGLEQPLGKDNPFASGIALVGSLAVPGGESGDIARARKLVKEATSAERVGGINLTRLNLSKNGEEIINNLKPVLEKIKGKALSHAEVVEDAQKGNLLEKVISRSETLKNESAMLASRSKLQSLDNIIETQIANGQDSKGAILEMINESKKVSSVATDWGRKLESLKVNPGEISTRTKVISELAKLSDDSEELARMASHVDWTDSREITKFYRQFVKPTTSDILTEYRYNNMLSGFKTQERNFLGNLTQTAILRPAVKLFSGDFKGAMEYYPGAVKALPEAFDAFKNTMSGKIPIESLDLDRVPTGKLPAWYGIPTRMSEAFDRMFSKIIEGGEMAGGKSLQEAQDISKYSLFRTAFDPTNKTGQGHVLSLIDKYLQKIDGLRELPGGKWILPFFRTPVQIAKMGIEYSPLGFTTVFGTEGIRQKEQLAKAFIGSGIALMGLKLADDDRLTWAPPSDATAKSLFYASGKKPFSLKVGNTWIPFNYLGPLATPLGLASAYSWYANEAPSSVTDNDIEIAGKIMLGALRVWASQTPVNNLGTFLDVILKENSDANIGNFFGQMATSVIPMNGLLRNIAQATDPIYRKTKGFIPQIESGIPGLSQNLPSYDLPTGETEKRLGINSILPYDIGVENNGTLPYGQMLDERNQQLQVNALNKSLVDKIENGSGSDISGSSLLVYIDPNIKKVLDMPEANDYQKQLKQEAIFSEIPKIYKNAYLTDEQKDEASKQLGINPELGRYYHTASQSPEARRALIMVMLQNSVNKDPMATLTGLRMEVGGKVVLTSEVINDLEDVGVINSQQASYLKNITINTKGNATVKRSGRSLPKLPVFKSPIIAFRPTRTQQQVTSLQGLPVRKAPTVPLVNMPNTSVPNFKPTVQPNYFAGLGLSGLKVR